MNIINDKIDENKTFTCLLGHPISHSISPKMHNTAFEKLGLDWEYHAYDVTKDTLKDALSELKELNVRGFNLTMPLKEAVIPYLDSVDKIAELTGSVNTVLNENGKLIGYTTDGAGYLESLYDNNIETTDKTICILGFGGAASSIITQAAFDGIKKIYVLRRKNEKFISSVNFADKIARETRCRIEVCDINNPEEMKRCIANSNILCNCTNVGMGDDERSLVDPSLLRKDLIVSDIIYHPPMTRLLRDAKSCGCKYLNGKNMLLFQGARAFKIWTGKDMPVDYIKREVFM